MVLRKMKRVTCSTKFNLAHLRVAPRDVIYGIPTCVVVFSVDAKGGVRGRFSSWGRVVRLTRAPLSDQSGSVGQPRVAIHVGLFAIVASDG